MDAKEKDKLLKDLESRIPGMKNPITRMALDRSIKQFQQTQAIIGKEKCRKMIELQSLTQDQKDYIYLKMGWL